MYSKKQLDVLRTPLPKYLVLQGVTGSGKSYVANLRFYSELCKLPAGSSVLITGNTSESLYKNVIKPLLGIDEGCKWLTYTTSPARLKCANGVECYLIGINSEGAEDRIQGGSVDLWYADEPTTYPHTAYSMCATRCRRVVDDKITTSPIIMTLNPDDELHYIKTDIIDKGESIGAKVYYFGFYDNPTMTQQYIDNLIATNSGDFLERMIYGKWSSNGDRRIIPELNDESIPQVVIPWTRPEHYVLYTGMDIAYNDYTAILCGYYDFRAAKYVIDSEALLRGKGSVDIAAAIEKCESAHNGKQPLTRVADSDLITLHDLRMLHGINIIPTAKDDKEAQINYVRTMIRERKIIITPNCTSLIRHLRVGVWNKNKTQFDRSEADGHYDMIDALLYLVRVIDKTYNPYPEIRTFDNFHGYDYISQEQKGFSALSNKSLITE